MNEGKSTPINVRITGKDLATGHQVAENVLKEVRGINGVVDTRIRQRLNYPEYVVTVNQAKASDQWSYFQAKGIKATLSEGEASIVAAEKPDVAAKLTEAAKRYRGETEEIKKQAEELEAKVTESNARSEEMMEHHHRFAIAVTLLQIAIALSAIAALTRRRALWFVGLAVSAAGTLMFIFGLL